MDIKTELAQVKEENGRFRQLLIDIFAELETIENKITVVETAVVNNDTSTERYIVELSAMITGAKQSIVDEVFDETRMRISID